MTADLSVPGAAEAVVRMLAERTLAIDILVNNAGFGTLGEFAREDPAELLGMLQVNVIPGLMNKVGVQALRLAPRWLAPKIVRGLHAEH